jgi:glutaredoxin 2
VAQKASILSGKDVGNGWVYQFLKRHEDTLVYKQAAPIDRQRAEANSYKNYYAYFTYLKSKLQEYQVLADQTYNIDEKGFTIGKMNATKRVFS